jgi:cytolysin (calcineurin-like family phosphatase)
MKQILEQNSDAVRQAGQALVEIGSELAAGQIDNAFDRLATEQQKYAEWQELDQAALDIEDAIANRKNTLAVQQVLTELLTAVLGSALRVGM